MVLTGPFSLLYVPAKTIVRGDAVATANKILANEFLFRSGIAVGLLSVVVFLVLVFVQYKLFKSVDEHLAKLMVVFVVVQVPIDFLLDTFNITSLMILKGEVLKASTLEQRQDMAMLFIKIGGYGTLILEIFWGLWLLPFGLLAYKSRFIPRILGVYLFINGIAYILISITFLLMPDYRALFEQYTFPLLFGEMAIMLWFLIMGVKVQKSYKLL